MLNLFTRAMRLSLACALVTFVSLPALGAEAALLAIEHVTVLPMTARANKPIPSATVLIRDGRIQSIMSSRSAKIPRSAQRIDGTGKWLIPALTDSHVHLVNPRMGRLLLQAQIADDSIATSDLLLPFVAAGVLQVIDLASMSETLAQKREVDTGAALGPHIATGAMVDGARPLWPPGMTRVAANPEEGRELVRAIKAEGYDFVKPYSALDPDTFEAIVQEARAQKLRVIAHLPARGQGLTERLLRSGVNAVAHAEELAYQSKDLSDQDIARFVALAQENDIVLIPTLAIPHGILEQVKDHEIMTRRPEFRFLSPLLRAFWTQRNPYTTGYTFPGLDRTIAFNVRLLKAFDAAGIPILAGTDASVPGMFPGFALHEELRAMVAAGMTNEQVLASATRVPAEWLGVSADRGTVEKGKRANLLLLDADPLADIGNTSRIAAVIANGRYLSRTELDEMLADLGKCNDAMPPVRAGSAK